jgi:hypothetical protein
MSSSSSSSSVPPSSLGSLSRPVSAAVIPVYDTRSPESDADDSPLVSTADASSATAEAVDSLSSQRAPDSVSLPLQANLDSSPSISLTPEMFAAMIQWMPESARASFSTLLKSPHTPPRSASAITSSDVTPQAPISTASPIEMFKSGITSTLSDPAAVLSHDHVVMSASVSTPPSALTLSSSSSSSAPIVTQATILVPDAPTLVSSSTSSTAGTRSSSSQPQTELTLAMIMDEKRVYLPGTDPTCAPISQELRDALINNVYVPTAKYKPTKLNRFSGSNSFDVDNTQTLMLQSSSSGGFQLKTHTVAQNVSSFAQLEFIHTFGIMPILQDEKEGLWVRAQRYRQLMVIVKEISQDRALYPIGERIAIDYYEQMRANADNESCIDAFNKKCLRTIDALRNSIQQAYVRQPSDGPRPARRSAPTSSPSGSSNRSGEVCRDYNTRAGCNRDACRYAHRVQCAHCKQAHFTFACPNPAQPQQGQSHSGKRKQPPPSGARHDANPKRHAGGDALPTDSLARSE